MLVWDTYTRYTCWGAVSRSDRSARVFNALLRTAETLSPTCDMCQYQDTFVLVSGHICCARHEFYDTCYASMSGHICMLVSGHICASIRTHLLRQTRVLRHSLCWYHDTFVYASIGTHLCMLASGHICICQYQDTFVYASIRTHLLRQTRVLGHIYSAVATDKTRVADLRQIRVSAAHMFYQLLTCFTCCFACSWYAYQHAFIQDIYWCTRIRTHLYSIYTSMGTHYSSKR